MPYFRRPYVQALLLKYSENAAFHLKDRRWLRHYCALCSQWIACASKVKQHYRLSHQQDHERYMLPASRLCSKGPACDYSCGSYFIQASRSGTATTPTVQLAQKWKKSQEEGATTTALRTTLFGCLIPNAAHGPEGHRRRSTHAIPDQSRGDEVAQGRQLVLPEVVPGTGEPSDRRRQAPTSACEASGGPATGTSHNPAALHDPPLSCHQTTGGQHDGGDHLPARHIESDKGPQHGLGVPGGPDGSVCAADHRTSAPTGHAQAVAGCHACPTSTGRILLIAAPQQQQYLLQLTPVYEHGCLRLATCRLPISSSLAHRSRRGGISTMQRRPLHVHALRSWRPLLRNWPNLHQQQDACEFLEHLLGAGRPPVLQGRWESRIVSDADGTETREQHHTRKSITLNFPNPNHPTTLQSLIDHWNNGSTYLQACTHPSRVLLLRLSRFQGSEDHGTIKVHTRVDIPTSVHVPCFSDPRHGDDCRSIPYLVVACVLHCGATIHAGHYTVRYINHLPPSTAPHAPPQWRADDSKPIEHIRTSVPHDSILGQQ